MRKILTVLRINNDEGKVTFSLLLLLAEAPVEPGASALTACNF
jgi:hypothetical protein